MKKENKQPVFTEREKALIARALNLYSIKLENDPRNMEELEKEVEEIYIKLIQK